MSATGTTTSGTNNANNSDVPIQTASPAGEVWYKKHKELLAAIGGIVGIIVGAFVIVGIVFPICKEIAEQEQLKKGGSTVECELAEPTFICGDDLCILKAYVCDNEDDCRDASDENATLCEDHGRPNEKSWHYKCLGISIGISAGLCLIVIIILVYCCSKKPRSICKRGRNTDAGTNDAERQPLTEITNSNEKNTNEVISSTNETDTNLEITNSNERNTNGVNISSTNETATNLDSLDGSRGSPVQAVHGNHAEGSTEPAAVNRTISSESQPIEEGTDEETVTMAVSGRSMNDGSIGAGGDKTGVTPESRNDGETTMAVSGSLINQRSVGGDKTDNVTPESSFTYDFFIISDDKEWEENTLTKLEQKKLKGFFARRDIKPGRIRQTSIIAAIKESRNCVIGFMDQDMTHNPLYVAVMQQEETLKNKRYREGRLIPVKLSKNALIPDEIGTAVCAINFWESDAINILYEAIE